MSLIPCTSNCMYQEDGYCTLERAASSGAPCGVKDCVHFLPKQGPAAVKPPDESMQS